MPTRIAARTLDTGTLVREHPPRLTNANKQVVYAAACPPGAVHEGRLTVSRWSAGALPGEMSRETATRFEARADVFDYPPDEPGSLAWHVNFADLRLFVAYGSGLLAQDELRSPSTRRAGHCASTSAPCATRISDRSRATSTVGRPPYWFAGSNGAVCSRPIPTWTKTAHTGFTASASRARSPRQCVARPGC